VNQNILLNTNSSYIICTLYTLISKDKIFKKLNLKKETHLKLNSDNNLFIPNENIEDLYVLLNAPALRRFAYSLVKPLINSSSQLIISAKKGNMLSQENYNEIILLKKYLRKFKYNYRRYFFCQSENYNDFPNDKEINMSAIKLLLLITGI
tara:strand:+ start:9036 stop:9488 length:453 start_codon:yes stop_codon:yes gene_type:complete